jgi:CHAT domain-containing protein
MNKLAGANVFHFAGHATSGPLISGLEIAPDTELVDAHQRALFTPESIASARLPSLDLVVLSACSTGMSEENDLAGFENIATAFLRSGVPRVIASRWNVDSTTTSLFMATFYELLLAGHSVSESVRLASVRVNGTPNTFHPYFWAPFSIFGRG